MIKILISSTISNSANNNAVTSCKAVDKYIIINNKATRSHTIVII